MDDNEFPARRFEAHRTHLRAVACRMPGSLSEADDAVQEAWFKLHRSDTSEVCTAARSDHQRHLSVRSARRAGASWSQIGAALGTSKQAAWEAHNRWIDEQAQEPSAGHWGWDADEVAAARALAGDPDGS
ncbi:hypothetical protein GCM10011583_60180 [Streptomyces camponoticapitis]|uniref:RNA polymerase sigma-70 region 2 domain-containing protein n=1 Tax=Streptomyces camponoticapitis TaxID=1616125 RepID=A0ABQ2EQ43_9ACTN|nr:hypothetical protein GCM10011583_60180 [Streptomyces camponoticapitis]